ncbi:hypothetical protein LguiA_019741 [Lonicera macranthoides]
MSQTLSLPKVSIILIMDKPPFISPSTINERRDISPLSFAVSRRDLKAKIILDMYHLFAPVNLLLHRRNDACLKMKKICDMTIIVMEER